MTGKRGSGRSFREGKGGAEDDRRKGCRGTLHRLPAGFWVQDRWRKAPMAAYI